MYVTQAAKTVKTVFTKFSLLLYYFA